MEKSKKEDNGVRNKKGDKWKAICEGCNLKCTIPVHFKEVVYRNNPFDMDNRHKCKKIRKIEEDVLRRIAIRREKQKQAKGSDIYWQNLANSLGVDP